MQNGYFGVGLYRPKQDHNVGQVLRASHNHGASYVSIEGARGKAIHGSANTTKTHLDTPVFTPEDLLDIRPHGAQIVVVDLIPGSTNLMEFEHPKNALYIFGPEDGTLGKRHTDAAQHVVHVPTSECMNLAGAVNVVLYDRMLKMHQKAAA